MTEFERMYEEHEQGKFNILFKLELIYRQDARQLRPDARPLTSSLS